MVRQDFVFPPGHRHLHDPGGGDQENPQRRVSVVPLQPRALVRNEKATPPHPRPHGHLSSPSLRPLVATYPPERLKKRPDVFFFLTNPV